MLRSMMLRMPLPQWFLYRVYYRFYCPGGGVRVRDCVAAGECGCNNAKR